MLLNKIFPAAKQLCGLVLRSTIWIHVESLKSFPVNSTTPSMIPKSQTQKRSRTGKPSHQGGYTHVTHGVVAGHCTCGRVPGWVFSVILWRKNTGSTTINEIYKLLFMNPVPLQRSIATRRHNLGSKFLLVASGHLGPTFRTQRGCTLGKPKWLWEALIRCKILVTLVEGRCNAGRLEWFE